MAETKLKEAKVLKFKRLIIFIILIIIDWAGVDKDGRETDAWNSWRLAGETHHKCKFHHRRYYP
jgi:hypothetical protein